jgi:hypothetical protein
VDHRSGVEFIANRDDLPIEKNLQQDKSEKKTTEYVAPLVLFENAMWDSTISPNLVQKINSRGR